MSSRISGAIADQLAEGGFGDQAVVIGFDGDLMTGANQGDDEDVGQRDGEIEIALAEAALIEIGVNGADGVMVVDQRNAERVGVVIEAIGFGLGALAGDPDGVALAANEFGEGIAELDGAG